MTRCSVGIFLSLMLFATPLLLAQASPPTGPVDIMVQLRPQPQGEPRKIVVGPRAAGVCPDSDDCSDHFTIRWLPPANEGEKIRIRFLDTAAAGKCFDYTDFTIDEPTTTRTVTLRAERPECPKKTFFFFEISCVGGEGGDCGGVQPVDPGAMVDGPGT